jgi:segregation and condensation protein B
MGNDQLQAESNAELPAESSAQTEHEQPENGRLENVSLEEDSSENDPLENSPSKSSLSENNQAVDDQLVSDQLSVDQLSTDQLQRIVEGALMAAGKPLAVDDLQALFDERERPAADAIRTALTAIAGQCAGRGFELREIASGFRFQVVQEVAPWIARLWEEKPQKYSRALLETLALIAYRQPITRGDIEDIRGVAVATNIIKTLLERDWVRVVGHKDVPGRPAMYATTRRFLDYFNLKNLDELPALADLRDLDALSAQLSIEGADTLLPEQQTEAEAEQQELIADANADADGNEPAAEDSAIEDADKTSQSSAVENDDVDTAGDIESDTGAVEAANNAIVDDEPPTVVDDAADEMTSVAQPSIGSVS